MKLPAAAGLSVLLILKSWFCTAARLVPNTKIPGLAGATVNEKAALTVLPTATAAVAFPGWVSQGTCALICVGLAKNSGAGRPLILSDAPPRLVGRGVLVAPAVLLARSVPNRDTIDPAATGDPAVKPPALVTAVTFGRSGAGGGGGLLEN